jgi:uncharacterized iron-regulated membrane protein
MGCTVDDVTEPSSYHADLHRASLLAGIPLMDIHAIAAAMQRCLLDGACFRDDHRLIIIGLMLLVGFVLIVSGFILYMIRTERTRH